MYGFNPRLGFKATLVFNEEISKHIRNSEIEDLLKIKNSREQVEKAVQLFEKTSSSLFDS